MLGRTMHGIDYDDLHDEIVVPQQFGQAILMFKGSARGEQPPVRVIQGSKTMLTALDRLAVDPHNDEIYVPEGDRVLVFDRKANGNVAPKRVLGARAPALPAPAPWRSTTRATCSSSAPTSGRGNQAAQLAIFDRTASGNSPGAGHRVARGRAIEDRQLLTAVSAAQFPPTMSRLRV